MEIILLLWRGFHTLWLETGTGYERVSSSRLDLLLHQRCLLSGMFRRQKWAVEMVWGRNWLVDMPLTFQQPLLQKTEAVTWGEQKRTCRVKGRKTKLRPE